VGFAGAGGAPAAAGAGHSAAAGISAIIAQLEDDSGLVSALEAPLPLLLRRLRRQSMLVRMKAVAFAAAVRRRRARERRRRLIQQHAMTRVRSFGADDRPQQELPQPAPQRERAGATAATAASLRARQTRYDAADSLRRDLDSWEHDLDDTEFGKNAAAHIVQSAWLRHVARKRAAAVDREREREKARRDQGKRVRTVPKR
jgi:hypothetical protein